MIYGDFPILQKGCHSIVNIVALLCYHNVVDMFSYNVLRNVNAQETFLEYVAATICTNVFITFTQRCGNVAATIYC